jgi:hypothetical protein
MSRLEIEMRKVISRWQELGANHLETHGNDEGNVPIAEAIRSQVEVVENRCTELNHFIEVWKKEGLL